MNKILDFILTNKYITSSHSYSSTLTIQGGLNLTEISATGVDIAATKSYTASQQAYDEFRVYSKASDVNGTYPDSFYTLISSSSRNSFVSSTGRSLTLVKSNWKYKETSKEVYFQNITAVNFIPDHKNAYEGQFLIGKDGSQTSCLFGVVDTYRYFKGTTSFFQMYAGQNMNQDFSCVGAYDYQGLIPGYYGSLNYSYAIGSTSGQIRVCTGLPKSIQKIKSIEDLGKVCGVLRIVSLSLRSNEYYSAVNFIQIEGVFFGIVNIRTKGIGSSFRQVFVDFGNGSQLPTFDINTYFYSVGNGKIWRIRRAFSGGGSVNFDYFTPSSLSSQKVIK